MSSKFVIGSGGAGMGGSSDLSVLEGAGLGECGQDRVAGRRAAHDELVVARVGLVVDVLRTVEAADVPAEAAGDGLRGAGVPLLEADLVHVHVRVPGEQHARLVSCGASGDEVALHGGGEAVHPFGGVGAADRDARASRLGARTADECALVAPLGSRALRL